MNLSPTIRNWHNQVGGDRGTPYGSAFMSTPIDGPYKEDGAWKGIILFIMMVNGT